MINENIYVLIIIEKVILLLSFIILRIINIIPVKTIATKPLIGNNFIKNSLKFIISIV